MGTLHVTYDTETGRILGIHRGAADAKTAQQSALAFAKIRSKTHTKPHAALSDAQIAVIAVPAEAMERKSLYTVDLARKQLVPARPDEGGAGGSFGASGGASSP